MGFVWLWRELFLRTPRLLVCCFYYEHTWGSYIEILSCTFLEFITTVLSALAGRAGHVPYEAWNTKDNHESAPLGTKLQQLASCFPPPLAHAEPHVPASSPPSRDPNDSHNKGFKITLVRLLCLLFGGISSPILDLRLWLLAAQLVTLAMDGRGIRNNFAISIGPLLFNGSIGFGAGAGAGAGAGGGGGRGGPPGTSGVVTGPVGEPGALGPSGPGPSNPIPWGKVAKVVGAVALGVTAVAPAATLAPVLGLAGFTAAGPAAASFAAAWQSWIGIVEAGSLFSMLTSIGMGGAGAAAPLLAAVGATAGAGAGVIGSGLVRDVFGKSTVEGTGYPVFHFSVTITILPLPNQ